MAGGAEAWDARPAPPLYSFVRPPIGTSWKGNREEIASLYRDFAPAIHRQCLAVLRDSEEARDATQEVFVKLFSARRLQDREHAAAWIYRVATHHCLNRVRNAQLHQGKLSQLSLDVASTVAPETFSARKLTQQLLSRFDETTCVVAVGVLVDGIEQTELATILGLSRRTVARKLEQFLAKARALLNGGNA
nr:sigma-70 family RNA polymerase sigma factor [Pyxidicoccus fallax]